VYFNKVINAEGVREIIQEIRSKSCQFEEQEGDKEIFESIKQNLRVIDSISAMAKEAENPESELRIEYGLFLQNLKDEEKVQINDILEMYVQERKEKEKLNLLRNKNNQNSSKKPRNKRKRQEEQPV